MELETEEEIILIKHEGLYCVIDGHHRIVNHILFSGYDTVVVKVLDNPKSKKLENYKPINIGLNEENYNYKKLEENNKDTYPKIRTNKVFMNERVSIPREKSKLVDKYIESNDFSALPLIEVNIKDIAPTQLNITMQNLRDVSEVELETHLSKKDKEYNSIKNNKLNCINRA